MSDKAQDRRPFQGLLQILWFNLPYYVTSAAGLTLAVALLTLRKWPGPVTTLGWISCLLGTWWIIASLVAAHVIYDRSPLMKWRVVGDLLSERPLQWANIHAGLDESTAALQALFQSSGVVLDIFDPGQMSEPSIRRARRRPSPAAAMPASYAALPLANASMDAVFLLFSAHELRAPASREQLFGEVARVLVPGGRLILAEHARDAANFAVFGPGFLHFLPRREWLRLAFRSGLKSGQELRITAFVSVWSLEKVQWTT